MPTVIRKSRPSDNNLPRIVGGRRVAVVIHRTGRLAGHTTVEGHTQALRVLPAASTWRALRESEAEEAPPTPAPKGLAWAVEVLSGSVKEVKAVLIELQEPEDVATLHATERAGANRSGVFKAIGKWEPTSG